MMLLTLCSARQAQSAEIVGFLLGSCTFAANLVLLLLLLLLL
jgi:hypothetical protein